MKVKELIKILLELNPEMEVVKTSSNFETNYATISLESAPSILKMKQVEKSFRDGFDGGNYTLTVWAHDKEKGQEVVKLT